MTPTLLIGLDGATFTILDPLMQRGVMPFLRNFAAGGVRANLRSIMPPLTPPGWTSLATGKRPGGHGVFDFFQKESAQSERLKLATSEDVHAATVWSLAGGAGKRVTVLNYPITFPAPAINGCVVPGGWMPWRQLRLGCHPAGLFDRLKALPSFDPRELSLDMKLEEKAVEGCAAEEYADWVELHLRRERRWLDIARFLMECEPADLTAIVFDGVDKLQHLCWRFLDPACCPADPSRWEQEMAARCESYFRQLDGIIAELVEAAGRDATVVLASDHGFGPASEVFHLNSWLEQQGFLTWSDGDGPPAGEPGRMGFSQIAHHLQALDLERTAAYAATPSGQGINIVRRRPSGAQALGWADYIRLRNRLSDALRQARHPVTGRPLVAEVWTREEAFPGPYQDLGPDLSIVLNDGAAVSILPGRELLEARPSAGGSHRWEGIFIAGGPALRSGLDLGELSIVDVAPLLLYSLGLPVPFDMDGRLPLAALAPRLVEARPPRFETPRGSSEGAAAASRPIELDAESEAVIVERLRALGYVE